MRSELSEHDHARRRFAAGGRRGRPIRLAVVGLCLAIAPVHSESALPEPVQVVEALNASLIDAMKGGDELGFNDRFRRLKPVIDSSFALSFMAQKSLGPHWTELEADEKSKYFEAYREYSAASYAGRFNAYNGERFETTSVSQLDRGGVTVVSDLVKSDGVRIAFTYKLRQGAAGWKIVDIHMGGVSQLALTRSQYTSIYRKEGLDGLLARLQQKIRDASREGRP